MLDSCMPRQQPLTATAAAQRGAMHSCDDLPRLQLNCYLSATRQFLYEGSGEGELVALPSFFSACSDANKQLG